MAALHLISNAQALVDCLKTVAPGDTLVLLEDGVYGLLTLAQQIQTQELRCVRLADDVAIRGLAPQDTDISYDQLVVLCTEHQPIATWC